MSGISEAQFRELQNNVASSGRSSVSVPRPLSSGSRKTKAAARTTFDGPVDVTLKLYGHCPSKKNLWSPRADGGFRLLPEIKEQIDALTTQALFGWSVHHPVEHPDLTVKFFVNAQRRDRDGMFVTVLDCLQAAGVLVNDNLAHNNGTTVLEPCEFVSVADERVEIRVVKK